MQARTLNTRGIRSWHCSCSICPSVTAVKGERSMTVERVLIMGAAGRDFHTFNTYFRENPSYEVVAFTAAQIPGIAGRRYPPALSGSRYPQGISIYPED